MAMFDFKSNSQVEELAATLKDKYTNLSNPEIESIAQDLENKQTGYQSNDIRGGSEGTYSDPIARIVRSKGGGSIQQAIYQLFYGLNRFSGVPYAPLNRTGNGFVFFTRPRLNLSYNNLTQVRTFTPLLTRSEHGTMRAIRALLDPVGSRNVDGYGSPMVNPSNPFLTILSNNLLTLSGWPEHVVDTYTSDPGIYREEWSIADGAPRQFGAFELTATFRNILGDPISWLFHFWTQYMLYVKEGSMDPYPHMLLDYEIDYDTRIYRIILDKTFTYVEKIAAIGAGFPISDNIASQFDYDAYKPIGDSTDEISVTFRCMGADYNDPISIYDFNRVSELFDPRITDQFRDQYYQKIKPSEALLMNHRGIPRINVFTMEFEWWILKSEYKKIISTGDTLEWLSK